MFSCNCNWAGPQRWRSFADQRQKAVSKQDFQVRSRDKSITSLLTVLEPHHGFLACKRKKLLVRLFYKERKTEESFNGVLTVPLVARNESWNNSGIGLNLFDRTLLTSPDCCRTVGTSNGGPVLSTCIIENAISHSYFSISENTFVYIHTCTRTRIVNVCIYKRCCYELIETIYCKRST